MLDFLDRLNSLNVYPEPFSFRAAEMSNWAKEAEKFVYDSLYRQFIRKDERNTNCPLRLSALGKPAMDLVCTKFFGHTEEADINWRTRSIFYQGDTFEGFIWFLLQSVGYKKLSAQDTIEWKGVLGHTDGRLLDADGVEWLVEFKTMNSRKFSRIKKEGMDIAEYITQMATYMDATGLPGAWICVNKDTSELMVIIPKREALVGHLNRAQYLVESFKKIEVFEDAYKYFRAPLITPITRGGKLIGWRVPDEMRWCKHVDKVYHIKPMKFYTEVVYPYYKAPKEYTNEWLKELNGQ